MIVETVSPVVVHLADMGSISTATESNEKLTFNEKAQPIADALTGLPVSTFQKTAKVLTDITERPNKCVHVNGPQSQKRKGKYFKISIIVRYMYIITIHFMRFHLLFC